MGTIFFAVPAPPAPAPANPWPGVVMRWHGSDGSEWDLTNGEVSGISLQPGVRGLSMPPIDRYTSTSPALPGSRNRGHRTAERPVFWPLRVFTDAGSQAWLEHDAAFWRTLEPGEVGVWTVTTPGGGTRSLRCRFASTDDAYDIDPALVGWALYGIYLVAESPYWEGDLVTRLFQPAEPVDFFPGPPFTISAGSVAETAAITNPGRVAAFPTWWVAGPNPTSAVGIGSRVVDIPFEVEDGRLLVVDSRPTARTAYEIDAPPLTPGGDPAPIEEQIAWVDEQLATAATNRTTELGATTRWGSVPAGGSVSLDVTLTGTGWVRVNLVPQHFRAW